MRQRAKLRFGAVAALALALAVPALAADPAKPAEPSAEQRQKMAAVHQKMAECLRSSRPFSECRQEMRESCRAMMGEAGCPMMEMGPGMMGEPMHPMMPGHPAPEAPKP